MRVFSVRRNVFGEAKSRRRSRNCNSANPRQVSDADITPSLRLAQCNAQHPRNVCRTTGKTKKKTKQKESAQIKKLEKKKNENCANRRKAQKAERSEKCDRDKRWLTSWRFIWTTTETRSVTEQHRVCEQRWSTHHRHPLHANKKFLIKCITLIRQCDIFIFYVPGVGHNNWHFSRLKFRQGDAEQDTPTLMLSIYNRSKRKISENSNLM